MFSIRNNNNNNNYISMSDDEKQIQLEESALFIQNDIHQY